ncbi:SDR family NAD(P)-dependent oxidoreductase [Microbacterium sp. SSM24]|uniref:SDR family NAD(P)-dependent oxidoreductase n=1 Tax=Microbacterium sp. SSM24 TaxID=2991714 RepID=UPI0022271CC1|nr:SDR family oxidoreductase [Microbacterium sp. SSM24]MCW3492710.1 SDR family oxidoreductase [Microbacterium sp. SSM24]
MWASDLFDGKVVAVTGAASGIGAAITRRFLEAGATVAAGDLQTELFTGLQNELGSELSRRLVPLAVDVSDSQSADAYISAVAGKLGRLDVLVNNAGIAPVGSVTATTDELWRKVMSVDVDGVFYVSRAALPHLTASGGNVINTASVSGVRADFNYAAYNAAKGAIVNFTRSMAIDYGKAGVRVNAIAPGPVRTPLLVKNLEALPGLEDAFGKFIPLGRIADPAEVADATVFLASPGASFITGAIVPVDGGVTAWNGQPNGDFVQ